MSFEKELIEKLNGIEEQIKKSKRGIGWLLEKMIIPIFLGILIYTVNKAANDIELSSLEIETNKASNAAVSSQKADDFRYTEIFFEYLTSGNDIKIQHAACFAQLVSDKRKRELESIIPSIKDTKCATEGSASPTTEVTKQPTSTQAEDAACVAAKDAIDWVVRGDAGALQTYMGARARGLDRVRSVMHAQGHNPNAQASLARCTEWAASYLERTNAP